MYGKLLLSVTVGAVLQLGLTAHSHALDGINSVEQLLSKLSYTLQERNYRGLFTYEYGGTLDTLEIVHVVRDGREYERLHHLSGPAREAVRQGKRVDCVSVGAQMLRGGLFSPRENSAPLHQYYDLSLGGTERVADRSATVVRLIPKDQYRYGFTLSVDKASGFPVKTLVVADNRRVLERIQFVDLELGIDPDSLDLESGSGERGAVSQVRNTCSDNGRTAGASAQGDTAEPPVKWEAQWLPRGFVLSDHSYSVSDGHQHTYTDGIASFSVFISAPENQITTQPNIAQRGATVALMVSLPLKEHPATVAVVGEVPPVTAEQVALGMRPVQVENK